MELSSMRRQVDRKLWELEQVKAKIKATKTKLKDLQADQQHVKEARDVLQRAAQQVQEISIDNLQSIVSHCLATVFDQPYQFKVVFEKKRGKTEARFVFVRNGVEIDPLTSCEGGAIDVASFALRVAVIVLSRPQKRRLLVLDEPFRFLKPPEVYGPRVVSMLESLSKDLGFQFIVIQNVPDYQAGDIIEV